MKKVLRLVAAVFLVAVTVIQALHTVATAQETTDSATLMSLGGVEQKLNSLRTKYPDGKWWNHYIATLDDRSNVLDNQSRDYAERFAETVSDYPCRIHTSLEEEQLIGTYDCNFFDGAWQCDGFAKKVFFDIFGCRVSQQSFRYDTNNIKVGDYVSFNTGHEAIVVERNGDALTVLSANYDYHCSIEWDDKTLSVSKATGFVRAPNYDAVNGSVNVETNVNFQPESSKYSIGETNAVLSAKITVSGGASYKDATQMGIILYDANGNELARKSESAYTGYDGYLLSWYDVNSELGVTLQKGTKYKFQFFVVINGTTYYEKDAMGSLREFTTSGAPVYYTISYDANGGTGAPASQSKIHGTDVVLSSQIPNKQGYTFLGWSGSPTGSVEFQAGAVCTYNYNLTLYAVWQANTYTVYFNANGGSISTVSRSVAYMSQYGDLPVPVREGYTFKGWYTNVDGGEQRTNAHYYDIADNQTLYARWQANTYTVYFNANGGSISIVSKSVAYMSQYGDLPVAEREGYSFKGWYTDISGGEERTYAHYYDIADNQTLYAHWQANTYTVSFDANGGEGAPESLTKSHGMALFMSDAAPIRDGFVFKGWALTANAVEADYNIGDEYVLEGDKTLYAVWEYKDDVIINSFHIIDNDLNKVYDIPKTSFRAELTFTNLRHDGTVTVVIATYDADGRMVDMRYLYTVPPKDLPMTLGASLKNPEGNIVKVKAFVIDTFESFTPLTQAVEINS